MTPLIENAWIAKLTARAGSLLLVLTFFTLPLNTLRPGGVAIGDYFVFALVVLAPVWLLFRGCPKDFIPKWMGISALFFVLSLGLVVVFPHEFTPDLYRRLTEVNEPYSSSVVVWARIIFALLLFPLVVALMLRSWDTVKLVAGAWVLGVALSALVAFVDVALGTEIQRSLSYDAAAIHGFLDADQYGQSVRQVGLTDHPNTLGLTAAMAFPMAFVLMGSRLQLLVFAPAALMLVAAVFLSGSRSALLGVVVSVIALCWLFRERLLVHIRGENHGRRRLALKIVAAVALLAMVPAALFAVAYVRDSGISLGGSATFERLDGDSAASQISNDERSQSMSASLDAIAEYPLVGSGFVWVETPHNIVLAMLMSGGVLALVAFIWALGGYLKDGFHARSLAEGRALTLMNGILASSLAMSVMLLLVNQTFNRYLYLPMGLILAGRLLVKTRQSPGS